jgi:hypothetical protein
MFKGFAGKLSLWTEMNRCGPPPGGPTPDSTARRICAGRAPEAAINLEIGMIDHIILDRRGAAGLG